MISFSLGRRARHADGLEQIRGAFDVLEERIVSDVRTKDGPYICGPLRAGRRNTESALPIGFAAIDLDHVADEIAMAAIVEAAERWRGIGYTTFSHNPAAGVFKMRLVFELDREVSREEYPRVCQAIADGLQSVAGVDVIIDPSCSKPEQPLYTARRGASVWRFDGKPVQAGPALQGVPPAPVRCSALDDGKSADPILAALYRDGRVLRDMGGGKFAIRCPFEAEHSREHTADDSSTAYFLPHTGGYARGHFACQHQHCAHRGQSAFRVALGIGEPERQKDLAGNRKGDLEPHGAQGTDEPEADDDASGPTAPEFSDDHLALQFVRLYRHTYRWTPGLEWMRDTGTHWSRDETLTRFNEARRVCRAAAARAPDKSQIRLASAKAVAAVVSLAQSDPRLVVPADQWDRDPFLLNTPEGVVDLRTGKMRRRQRRDHFTQVSAVSPDSTMRCTNWLRFLTEVFSMDLEMVEFVQRMLGYILTGDRREQKLFFAHGAGANGKSTLLDLVLWILGTYALKLPTTALMQSAVERHPTELAQLRGKRLAMSNELEEGGFWAESRIKELTGDETLTARFMRQDFFEFRQTQKHLIAGNHKPRLRGGDPAIARRMVLIPFAEVFEGRRKDKALPEKLRVEAPGVLAWMIEGARKWYADGLAIPSKVQAASREYLDDNDDVAMWIAECCTTGEGCKEKSTELYQSFAVWKKDRGEHAPSQSTWGQRLALVPGITRRKSSAVVYEGIWLKAEARAALHARLQPSGGGRRPGDVA